MFIVMTFVCFTNAKCAFLEPVKIQPTYEACVAEASELIREVWAQPTVLKAHNACISLNKK